MQKMLYIVVDLRFLTIDVKSYQSMSVYACIKSFNVKDRNDLQ